MAPYGILQSLLRDQDLKATLDSVSRVLRPGGTFGLDLVPDVPHWKEYTERVQMRGKAAGGAHLTPGGVGAPGSAAPADHLRTGVSGPPRPPHHAASVHVDLPDGADCRGWSDAWSGPALQSAPSSAIIVATPGMTGPTYGSSWRKRCKIFRPISLIFLEFRHVRPFQVALNQAQEGRR